MDERVRVKWFATDHYREQMEQMAANWRHRMSDYKKKTAAKFAELEAEIERLRTSNRRKYSEGGHSDQQHKEVEPEMARNSETHCIGDRTLNPMPSLESDLSTPRPPAPTSRGIEHIATERNEAQPESVQSALSPHSITRSMAISTTSHMEHDQNVEIYIPPPLDSMQRSSDRKNPIRRHPFNQRMP